jgi:ubiquinone/menaquinone biosynthesis C-methylase UbiE
MALISVSDFIDLWYKFKERGTAYAAKKLVSTSKQRIQSTWEDDDLPSSNWWQVELVRKRWNYLITGHENVIYPDYVVNKYLANKTGINMLSIGCGTGQRELEFGAHPCFNKIDAFDIAQKVIDDAQKSALERGITTCNFFVADVYNNALRYHDYDIVFFHSSLHHFKDVDGLLQNIKQKVKPGTLIIINEYVGANRFQFGTSRKTYLKQVYKTEVPAVLKTRKCGATKSRLYFPSWLRMIISDPSEAVESADIMPLLNKHFTLIEQKRYGGNLLTFILKDIAHGFNAPEAKDTLTHLFELEDKLMLTEQQKD